VRFSIWLVSWVINLENAVWDDKLLNGLEFMSKSVLQVPFLLMTLMRYVTPTLDEMYVFLRPQLTVTLTIQLHAIHSMGGQHLHSEA
jgi:hypothetical protein